MSSPFIRLFPPAALALSLAAMVLLTGPVVVAYSLSVDQMRVGPADLSPLHALVVRHFRVFALSWWILSAAAVIASVGLIRRRRWAHSTWVLLLSLVLLWSLAVTLSEVFHLIIGEERPEEAIGYFPSDALLSALVTIPTGIGMTIVLVVLLRQLLLHRHELSPQRS